MVGLRKLYITLAISLLSLPSVAQGNLGGFAERQMRQLSLRAERAQLNLDIARAEYATSPNDSLAMVIHELEKQREAIENAIARIAAVQKEEQIEEPSEPIQEPAVQPTPEVVVAENVEQEEPNAIEENEDSAESETIVQELIISDNLKALFNTTRRRYALTQSEIDTLVGRYATTYNAIEKALADYDNATSLQKLEGHYGDYLKAVEDADRIANEIADRSDRLFTSKMGAYFGFADSLGIDTLRAHHTRRSEDMEMTMGEKLVGKCSDLDLAMYPHRLRETMFLEAELAQYLEPEIADSLLLMAKNYDCTYTLFAPIGTPKRAQSKFHAITIKKKSKEKAVSSLPTLTIPAEGELYSITVANYASLPPSTKVFRGATPLYREQREDGRTYIYLGMYPTARSAEEDIALLRKAGFKQPTLVMWRDGIRRDDWVERNTSTAPKTAMYRVEIAGIEGAMPESVMAIIKEKAPRKEISKYTSSEGVVIYTLGIFTKQSEAQAIATAITKASPSLTATFTQVGKK